MSFKLNLGQLQAFALPTHHIISIQGEDSVVFLQSQLMNDVNSLVVGRWHYTGILNPQGRVLALFQLAQIESDHFLLILASLDVQWLIQHFKRFVFRSKVHIKYEQDYQVHGQLFDDSSSNEVAHAVSGNALSGYTIDIPDKNCTRKMFVTNTHAETDPQALDQWHCLDMANGWLWVDESLQNLWTPQMLSLQDINAFSLKKGCYPGQEIVARTHYLGKSKRNLLTISGQGFKPGQALYQNANEIGKIANCNKAGDFAKAVLPVELNMELPITNDKSIIKMIY